MRDLPVSLVADVKYRALVQIHTSAFSIFFFFTKIVALNSEKPIGQKYCLQYFSDEKVCIHLKLLS